MRIRKRPSSAAAPLKKRLIQQLPATYKYVFSTGWLLKRAFEEHDKQQQQQSTTGLLRHPAEQRGLSLHGGGLGQNDGVANTSSLHCYRCVEQDRGSVLNRECKQPPPPPQQQDPIGEEPRTPPPFCGEKPAFARQRSEHELHAQQLKQQPSSSTSPRGERKLCSCSCGTDQQQQQQQQKQQKQQQQQTKKTRRKQIQDSVKGESSGCGRKRSRTRVPPTTSGDEHGSRPSRLRDTAESSERSSHDNCGPPQPQLRFNAGGGASSLGDSYLRELSKMDPLRRALHTVVSEAGIAGLTAREAAERISRRRLLAETDIPRSVKMAKVMRDSPYLLELSSRGSKFVLWSTFLEESSKRANCLANSAAPAADRSPSTTGTAKTRTRRHGFAAPSPRDAAAAAATAAAAAAAASASAAATAAAAALIVSLRDQGQGQGQGHAARNQDHHLQHHHHHHHRSANGNGVVDFRAQAHGVPDDHAGTTGRFPVRQWEIVRRSDGRAAAAAAVDSNGIGKEVDNLFRIPIKSETINAEAEEARPAKRQFFDLNLAPQEQEDMVD